MNLRWSWDERTRDLFRWVDPEAWDADQHDPVRLLGHRGARAARGARRRPGLPRGTSTEIDDELTRYLTQPRWFQSARADSPLAPGRLLLPRVRHLRSAAAVLGRPRRAGRRPPQGGLRPRRPARRHRAVLPPRLLPPEPQPRRLAAGALPRRSTRTRMAHHAVRRHHGHRRRWPARRASARCGGPTSAARRCTCSTPTSTATRRDAPPGHRPAVRRRHRAPHAPGDRPRHRRRPGPAGPRARRRRCSTPTRATPASSAWSASASWCSRA